MTLGTKVYLNWYDFAKQAEHICMGEVVDNESWTDTKYSDMINGKDESEDELVIAGLEEEEAAAAAEPEEEIKVYGVEAIVE